MRLFEIAIDLPMTQEEYLMELPCFLAENQNNSNIIADRKAFDFKEMGK